MHSLPGIGQSLGTSDTTVAQQTPASIAHVNTVRTGDTAPSSSSPVAGIENSTSSATGYAHADKDYPHSMSHKRVNEQSDSSTADAEGNGPNGRGKRLRIASKRAHEANAIGV